MTAQLVDVTHNPFSDDTGDMPLAHSDVRRDIHEKVGSDGVRVTKIMVRTAGLPLGNHYHTGDEAFRDRGRGVLYVELPVDDSVREAVELPEGGWEVLVPRGVAHKFVFDGEPDDDGVIAVLISTADWMFEQGVNTFPCTID